MTIYRKTLAHTGILGMKWGIRRYQNEDGTLTPAGKERYSKTGKSGYEYKSFLTKHHEKRAHKLEQKSARLRLAGKLGRAEAIAEKANRSRAKAEYNSDIDKRVQEYARTESSGRNFIKQLLSFGSIGSNAYATALAVSGGDHGSSLTKKGDAAGTAFMSHLLAGPLASLIIRSDGFLSQEIRQDTVRRYEDAVNSRSTVRSRNGKR